jgi:hypothetical protein
MNLRVKPSYDLHGDPIAPSACLHCGNQTTPMNNFCGMECHVAAARAEGGRDIRPNDLPVTCIRYDANGILLLEHEHADHPDYRFPVEVEWVGPDEHDDFSGFDGSGQSVRLPESIVASMKHESHALLFTDGIAAVTIHDAEHALWYLDDGRCGGGRPRVAFHWRMAEPSRTAARLDRSRKVSAPPLSEAQVHRRMPASQHPAFIHPVEVLYTDGYVVLSVYKGEYALWDVRSGKCIADRCVWTPTEWRLSPAACEACAALRTRGRAPS